MQLSDTTASRLPRVTNLGTRRRDRGPLLVPTPTERMNEMLRATHSFSLLVAFVLLVAAGCSTPATKALPEPTPTPIPAPAAVEPVRSGICVDGTGSVPASVVAMMVGAIRALFAEWVPTA